jgi:hypothetical protein
VEGQESEAKQYQGQRLGAVTKPTHGSLWEARAKMDDPFLVTKKKDQAHSDWQTPKAKHCSILGMLTTSVVFIFNVSL